MARRRQAGPATPGAGFAAWFRAELDRRGWTASKMARATGFDGTPGSGIYPSQISRYLYGDRTPMPRVCRQFAAALGEDPRTLLAAAGHLTEEEAPEDPWLAGFFAKLRRVDLTPGRREQLEIMVTAWRERDQRERSSADPATSA